MNSWCSDAHPIAIRNSIAGFLGNNWKRLAYGFEADSQRSSSKHSNSVLFWLMLVALLQDVEEEIRNTMCKAISPMLLQMAHIGGRLSWVIR